MCAHWGIASARTQGGDRRGRSTIVHIFRLHVQGWGGLRDARTSIEIDVAPGVGSRAGARTRRVPSSVVVIEYLMKENSCDNIVDYPYLSNGLLAFAHQ